MARRASSSDAGGLLVIVAGFGLWELFHSQVALAWASVIVAVIILGWTLSVHAQWVGARSIIRDHARELRVRRRQLTIKGSYDLVDTTKWENDVAIFMERVIAPRAGTIKPGSLNFTRVISLINQVTSDFDSLRSDYSSTMDPVDYERMVAGRLTDLGWKTRVTKGSGDQGIDVIAEMRTAKVVIQCKLYSSSVGNAAVQEAISGKAFELATHAAVVSNAQYTSSAKQLASSTGIYLLHHDQLEMLEENIFGTADWKQLRAESSEAVLEAFPDRSLNKGLRDASILIAVSIFATVLVVLYNKIKSAGPDTTRADTIVAPTTLPTATTTEKQAQGVKTR